MRDGLFQIVLGGAGVDYFSLCLDGLCLGGQSVLHMIFTCRLTGKRQKPWHFALYFSLLCVLELTFSRLCPGGGIVPIGAGVLALYGVSRLALGNRRPVSWLAAVLAFYISQLSFGVVNSLESVVFPRFVGCPLLYPLLLAALALFFALCAGCYAAALRLLDRPQDGQTPYIGLLLLPGLFFFAAQLYILRTSYSVVSVNLPAEEIPRHAALLFLQAMGLAALLCTLYAYRCLCRGFQAQAALQSLTQAAQAQKTYIAEARLRDERTAAFRHDVKNHLSVLSGLLGGGRLEEGRAYLKRLEGISAALSFPYQTGNPVVDILLGEKLGLAEAEGIGAEVSLCLPAPWGVDDLDLCVIAANALDNAVSACRSVQGERRIRVSGERQGDFYLLVFENSCPDGPLPPPGTGLSNIKAAAEKYRGAMLAEQKDGRFSLSVLLNIS